MSTPLILLYYPMPFPVPHFYIHYPPLPTIQTQSQGQAVFPVIIRRQTPPRGGLSSPLSSLSSSVQTNKTQSHSWPLEIWTAQRKSSEGSCALCDDVNSPQIGRGAGRGPQVGFQIRTDVLALNVATRATVYCIAQMLRPQLPLPLWLTIDQ